jgi:hypothetical protein
MATPKWILRSWTVLLNLAVVLPLLVNEMIPVLTQYREVLSLTDQQWKGVLLAAAILNIWIRVFRTRTPISLSAPVPPTPPPTPPPTLLPGWDADPGMDPGDGE